MRRILQSIIALFLTVTIMAAEVVPVLADNELLVRSQLTESGTKTGANYTYIYNANDMNNIRKNLSGNYILMADIDLSSMEWTPIGTANEPFTGTFEGNNHTIYGLKIDSSDLSLSSAGLFGYIVDARVCNLSVLDATIRANGVNTIKLGTIAGCMCDSTVENCNVNTNIVTIANQWVAVGGIVGALDSSAVDGANIIRNCTTKGSISVTCKTANAMAGGIIGCCVSQNKSGTDKTTELVKCANHATITANSAGQTHCAGIAGYFSSYYSSKQTIDCCYNTGDITASRSSSTDCTYAAGIVGYCDAFENSVTIVSNCYNTGTISGRDGCGGIAFRTFIGWISPYSSGKSVEFKNCYNAGKLKSSYNSNRLNPICGSNHNCTFTNCYYLSSTGSDSLGKALTETNMKSAASFPSFDFSSVWQFSGDSSYLYPVLQGVYSSSTSDISDEICHLIFSDMSYARIPKVYIGKTVSRWLDTSAFSTDPTYGYSAEEMYQPIYSSSTLSRVDVYRLVGDWTILDLIDGDAGYAAAVFQKGSDIIIAYRGSEGGPQTMFSGEDWTVDMEFALFNKLDPSQFDAALQTYYKYRSKGNVSLTGHSLGGALVAYVSTITEAPGYSFDGAVGHVIDLTYLFEAGNIDFSSTADMTFKNYTDPKSLSCTVADMIQHTNSDLFPGVCYQTNSDCIKYYNTLFWTHQQYSNTKPGTGSTIEFMPVAEEHTATSNWYASVDMEYLGLLLGAVGGSFTGHLSSACSWASKGGKLGRLIKMGNVYLGTSGDDTITVSGSISSLLDATANVTTNVIYGGDGSDSILGGCVSDILIPGSLEGDLLCGGSGNDDYLIDYNKSGYVFIEDISGKDRIVLLNAENLSSSAITYAGTSEDGKWHIYDIGGKIKIYIFRLFKHKFTVIDANERELCTVSADGNMNALRAVSDSTENAHKDIYISGNGRLDIYESDGTLVASYETDQYGQYSEAFGMVTVAQNENENFLSATICESYYAEVVGSEIVDILLVGTDDDGYVKKTTSVEDIDLSKGTVSINFLEQTISQSNNELNIEETEKTTRVSISTEETTIRVGDSVELSATAFFDDGDETKDIYWVSSDPTIVQCNYDADGNCTLSACKEGEVDIYAIATDSGYSATCKVSAYCTHNYECVNQSPTCTEEGADIYTCTICGDIYRENVVPATGHSYEDGFCTVCKEMDPNAPIKDATLKFKSASLTLWSDISMNFYVSDSVLEGWDDPYVAFKKALYDSDGNIVGYETEIVTDFTLSSTACHIFRFDGVTSREMSSAITATLYAYRNGELYVGATVEYSVIKYASNMLTRSSSSTLQTLLVDLLNYGASSQTYFNYNTANLPNAFLTEEQKGYATADAPTIASCTQLISNDGATVSFKAASLTLEDKVTINYYLNVDRYNESIDDLELHVNYTDAYNQESTKIIDSSEFVYKLYGGTYRYMANFSELYAFQMRDKCTAEVFSKSTGERISNTVIYSIESYVAGKMNNADEKLVKLVVDMIKYGDSASSYFT